MSEDTFESVLLFWFGEQKDGYPIEPRGKLWFGGGNDIDETIHTSFGNLVEKALNKELIDWESTSPQSLLALIILTDQFTRSIYRKTPAAFSGDDYALALSHKCIENEWDKQLSFSERQFAYMPLMHSEQIEDQELCIQVFTQLQNDVPADKKEDAGGSVWYAKDHRDVIARFGRFPHRNSVLGRESTLEEQSYLDDGAKTYGQ
ncbi:DUF924 family protein [Parendozoicomonas haliclonae]|uniref:DUF924 domain-containing protein n=1 Tax=Parendozoicomonas haliclonae TaxID=1960125 RepID=A0A1X7ANR9_9GAMM|nr:DUF924 family protein [Parendozoicomonas haliclonae]SMA49748.1 hypothetical protein EHSB41UT_03534 [Parendozoicomonas haliclonae]